jgi:hypothetical protein
LLNFFFAEYNSARQGAAAYAYSVSNGLPVKLRRIFKREF